MYQKNVNQARQSLLAGAVEGDIRKIYEPLGILSEYYGSSGEAINQTRDVTENATALHWAAYHGKTDAVKYLLLWGANIEALHRNATNANSTPLLWAACAGHTETVKILLEHGANIYAQNTAGVTPLSIARHNGYQETVALLESCLPATATSERVVGGLFGLGMMAAGAVVSFSFPPAGAAVGVMGGNLFKQSVTNDHFNLDRAAGEGVKLAIPIAAAAMVTPIAAKLLPATRGGTAIAAATGPVTSSAVTQAVNVATSAATPSAQEVASDFVTDAFKNAIGEGAQAVGGVLGQGVVRGAGMSHPIVTTAANDVGASLLSSATATGIRCATQERGPQRKDAVDMALSAATSAVTGAMRGAFKAAAEREKQAPAAEKKPAPVQQPPAASTTQSDATSSQDGQATSKSSPADAKSDLHREVDASVSGFKKGHYTYKGKPLTNTDKKVFAAKIKSGINPGKIKNKDGSTAFDGARLAGEARRVNALASTPVQPAVPSKSTVHRKVDAVVDKLKKVEGATHKGKPVKGGNAKDLAKRVKSGEPAKVKSKEGKVIFDGAALAEQAQRVNSDSSPAADASASASANALAEAAYPGEYSRQPSPEMAAILQGLSRGEREIIFRRWISSYLDDIQYAYNVSLKDGHATLEGRTKVKYAKAYIPVTEHNKQEIVHHIFTRVMQGEPVKFISPFGTKIIEQQWFGECMLTLGLSAKEEAPVASTVASKPSIPAIPVVEGPTVTIPVVPAEPEIPLAQQPTPAMPQEPTPPFETVLQSDQAAAVAFDSHPIPHVLKPVSRISLRATSGSGSAAPVTPKVQLDSVLQSELSAHQVLHDVTRHEEPPVLVSRDQSDSDEEDDTHETTEERQSTTFATTEALPVGEASIGRTAQVDRATSSDEEPLFEDMERREHDADRSDYLREPETPARCRGRFFAGAARGILSDSRRVRNHRANATTTATTIAGPHRPGAHTVDDLIQLAFDSENGYANNFSQRGLGGRR